MREISVFPSQLGNSIPFLHKGALNKHHCSGKDRYLPSCKVSIHCSTESAIRNYRVRSPAFSSRSRARSIRPEQPERTLITPPSSCPSSPISTLNPAPSAKNSEQCPFRWSIPDDEPRRQALCNTITTLPTHSTYQSPPTPESCLVGFQVIGVSRLTGLKRAFQEEMEEKSRKRIRVESGGLLN